MFDDAFVECLKEFRVMLLNPFQHLFNGPGRWVLWLAHHPWDMQASPWNGKWKSLTSGDTQSIKQASKIHPRKIPKGGFLPMPNYFGGIFIKSVVVI